MKEVLSGIEARDRGIATLCEEIAPAGYQVVITHEPLPCEDLDAEPSEKGPVRGDGTPVWVYGSTLPRALMGRASKVQVHEPFAPDEVPDWFDPEFPRYLGEHALPGYSCFSTASVRQAADTLLATYARVRLKDPQGASGVGQWTVGDPGEIETTLSLVAAHVGSDDDELAGYLATYGFVVEADVEDVEAWSVTLTRTPDGHFSSFGRIVEVRLDLTERGAVQNYGGTSVVVVRGDPVGLAEVPTGGVEIDDPGCPEPFVLAPAPSVIAAAQRFIEGLRLWESERAFETRANVDVITGTLVARDGTRRDVAAAVEESGRIGGASPAELLAIQALEADPGLLYVARSTRHGFDDTGRTYSAHAASVPGSRVFWDGPDENWDGRYVFIGAF